MTSWKPIAVFGAAGVSLSLIFGIVAGNPFAVILLRVFVSGAAAAALGFGVSWVVDRFLPEVRGGAAPGGAGEHVDIVVPGENPHGDGALPETEPAAVEGAVTDAEAVAGAADGEAEGVTELGEIDAAVADEADGIAEAGEIGAIGDEAVGELEEAGDETAPAGSPGALGSLGGGKAGSVQVGGQDQEPEIVARALRTMMKRDGEG